MNQHLFLCGKAIEQNAIMPSCTPGNRLKKARRRLGLTQQGVADQISQSIDTYKGWEQNRTQPRTYAMTKRVCDLLHITVDHYLGGASNTHLQPDELELLEHYRMLSDEVKTALMVVIRDSVKR